MAKRLTGTDKWDKSWFRKLEPKYKCFWEYIRDKCDLIGLWEKDFESASFHIGVEITEEEVMKIFAGKLIQHEKRILVKSFCHFQYGETLNLKSPIHKKIHDLLQRHTLYDTLYSRVVNRAEEEEEVEDKEEEEVKREKEDKSKTEIVYPFNSETFLSQWDLWLDYKRTEFKFKYKTAQSQQAALKELAKVSGGVEQVAIDIIHRSMSNGWKGFFKLDDSATQKDERSAAEKTEDIMRKFHKGYEG